MRQQYDRTLITLNEHSRRLPPLQINDSVFVQNQTGVTLGKWDRICVVMEIKPNDQYVIKISGTGRLTLRNRRFLRKVKVYTPPVINQQPHQPDPCVQQPPVPVYFQLYNQSAATTPITR